MAMIPKFSVTQVITAAATGTKNATQNRLVFGVAACLALLAQPAQAHWCDSSAQSNPIERAICNDTSLLRKDIELNHLYSALGGSQNGNLKATQRSWLKARNSCTNMDCLRAFYDDRLRVLRAMAGVQTSPVATPPPPAASAPPPPSSAEPDDLPDIKPF
jgi:uncharacterized protein